MQNKKPINLITPINSLGYGVAGLNILLQLNKIANVTLWPLGEPDAERRHFPILKECIQNTKMPDFKAPCLRVWHQHDMSQFVGSGCKIGFPIFELDTLTSEEKHHLSHLDKIFVCSEWAKLVIQENLPSFDKSDIFVIPLGVDRDVFQESHSSRKETVFFNCGKWEVRKGHDFLIEAFLEAFSPEDDVELWMMCQNPFYSQEENLSWESKYKDSALGDKIRIIPRQTTQKDVYNIMRQIDCGGFPSRAEGWNLELLELMSCGKHVIATDYSGHTQFCNKENCLLIDIEDKEEAVDNKWFFGQGKWASLGEKQLRQTAYYMSAIHRAKSRGSLDPNINCTATAEKFSWQNTAREIINAIST